MRLTNHQFSALIKDNIIITFQETYEENFEGVKNRLKVGKGSIRTAGAGYMCYCFTDTILLDLLFCIAGNAGRPIGPG